MTNLQLLLSVLKLDDELEKEIIIKYFSDQDSIEFEVEGDNFLFLDRYEIEDRLFSQYEEDLFDFLEYAERYRGYPYYDLIEQNNIINKRVKDFDYDDLNNLLFITKIEELYLYKEV